MKINRFVALAAIALLIVAGMGAVATGSFAKNSHAPAAHSQDCDQDDDDSAEVQDAADTDDVEEQCGDQNEADADDGEEAVGLDTDNVEEEVVNQTEVDAGEEADGAEAVPAGTPAITAEEAQTAALTAYSGTIVQTELDDENGQLVYSVEFDGDVDVKVDAMTGEVLGTETGQD